MQEKTKNVLLVVLIVGLVSMTVAYAALSTTLTISSSAKVAGSSWNIEITGWTQDTSVTNLNGGVNEGTVKASPNVGKTTVTGIEASFKKPGDRVKFTFNIVNTGDIDAVLTDATSMTETKNKVTKTVKCGSPLATPVAGNSAFELAKKTGTIACEMEISYDKNETSMPTPPEGEDATTVTLTDVTFVYGQK